MQYNQILGSIWSQFSEKLFGARTGTIAPEIAVELGLFDRPEFWALFGGTLYGGFVSLAAGGAGTRSEVYLRNPGAGVSATPGDPGANRLLSLCEQVYVRPTVLLVLEVGLNYQAAEPGNSTGNLVIRDTRRATTVGSSGPIGSRLRTSNAAGAIAFGTSLFNVICAANVTTIIPVEVVLAPGWFLTFRPDTDNVAIQINVVGRERPATIAELRGL